MLRVWRGGSGWRRVLWEGSFALSILIAWLGRPRRVGFEHLDRVIVKAAKICGVRSGYGQKRRSTSEVGEEWLEP